MLYVFAQGIVPSGSWTITQSLLSPGEAARRIVEAHGVGMLSTQVFYQTTAESLQDLVDYHGAPDSLRIACIRRGDCISLQAGETFFSGDSILLVRLTAEAIRDLRKNETPGWETDLRYDLLEYSERTGSQGRPKGRSRATEEKIARAVELEKQGLSVPEIAKEMDAAESTVYGWLRVI